MSFLQLSSRTMLSRVARTINSRFASAASVVSGTAPYSSSSYVSSEALVPGIGKAKTSTGLVGLEVDHDAIPKIIAKYQLLLDTMAASDMPESAFYRSTLEKLCRYRIQAAQENPDDPEKVEEICNCGQVEELVLQADDEMEVLQMYIRNRWWEEVEQDVDILYDPDPEDLDDEE
uniref:Uncharacterized protein n=1 Tax=Cyclophora tenuis TaxID=216820 RepID=A0A6U1QVV9_CYCTE|mmetsp:Transcript_2028/g.3586  ORF Transcript_2028/g.3586 Transcript_2028/m.3586 type:complete len:175 (+) Transcript_2028:55-579(+)